MFVEPRHCCADSRRGCRIADARTWQRECLGETLNDHRSALHALESCNADVTMPVENELVEALVREHPHVAIERQGCNIVQLVVCKYPAGRVVRSIDDDGARPIADAIAKQFCV